MTKEQLDALIIWVESQIEFEIAREAGGEPGTYIKAAESEARDLLYKSFGLSRY
jgi:hypothetical protein